MKTQVRLVEAAEFKTEISDGDTDRDDLGLKKTYVTEVKAVAGEDLTLAFTISDGDVDRDRDTISPKGWDLKSFRKNPVVLFAHDSRQPPIAQATKIGLEDKTRLVAHAKFTPEDLNPFGFMIFRMFEQRFMRATSVGFLPTKYEWVEDDEERRGGIDFLKQELLEFSAVPVPANPRALIQAHELGINTAPLRDWVIQLLDGAEEFKGLSRDQVEAAWDVLEKRPTIIDLGAGKDSDPEDPQPTPELAEAVVSAMTLRGSTAPDPDPEPEPVSGVKLRDLVEAVVEDHLGTILDRRVEMQVELALNARGYQADVLSPDDDDDFEVEDAPVERSEADDPDPDDDDDDPEFSMEDAMRALREITQEALARATESAT